VRGQESQPGEAGRQMQRGRPSSRGEAVHATVARDERELPVDPKTCTQPAAITKVPKVRAAAEADVLAVVDPGSGRLVLEGTRPSSEPGPRFEQRHGEPAGGQRFGRSEPRQAAAHNDYAFRHSVA
jgi:hypothetical protein